VLADVLRQAVETVQPRIAERGQALTGRTAAGTVVVEGDQVRLTQVFTNLLGNASKYTGDGGTLRLAAHAGTGRDRGDVSRQRHRHRARGAAHIFDLFTQGPRSLARSEGGLGVGLNVVRNLVGMHARDGAAHSDGPGRGSRFTVRLPRSGAAGQPARPARPAGRRPRRKPGAARGRQPDTCATLAACLRVEGHDVVCEALDGRSGPGGGARASLGT
jgi:signal transduction histidine kinase